MREVSLKLENIHCDACVRRVSMTLEKAGVKVVDAAVGTAQIYAPDGLNDSTILQALDKAGYPATVEATRV